MTNKIFTEAQSWLAKAGLTPYIKNYEKNYEFNRITFKIVSPVNSEFEGSLHFRYDGVIYLNRAYIYYKKKTYFYFDTNCFQKSFVYLTVFVTPDKLNELLKNIGFFSGEYPEKYPLFCEEEISEPSNTFQTALKEASISSPFKHPNTPANFRELVCEWVTKAGLAPYVRAFKFMEDDTDAFIFFKFDQYDKDNYATVYFSSTALWDKPFSTLDISGIEGIHISKIDFYFMNNFYFKFDYVRSRDEKGHGPRKMTYDDLHNLLVDLKYIPAKK